MDQDKVLNELNFLIKRLDAVRDIMIASTKVVIDTGNINFELLNAINNLDIIIDSFEDTTEKSILETAKDHITYASVDVLDDPDIFNKINRLKIAEKILIDIKTNIEYETNQFD